MLTDNKFMALGRMSVDRGRGPRGTEEALGAAQPVCFDSLFGVKRMLRNCCCGIPLLLPLSSSLLAESREEEQQRQLYPARLSNNPT